MKAVVLLTAYSGVLTVGLLAVGWMAISPRHEAFGTIDVQRINVREPDGRLRMVIADHARFPGAIMHGRETSFDRASAGVIFLDDEVTEDGGLIFTGKRDAHGHISTTGHLSFDQYDQDQVVKLEQSETDGDREAGLTVYDRPDAPLDIPGTVRLLRQNKAAVLDAVARGAFGQTRAFFGKDGVKDAILALRDAAGRVRMRLSVSATGAASMAFLDQEGRIVRLIGPTD